MASGWHNKLARLSRMDWDEVRTRLGQELHKRGELLLHRLGMPPATMRLSESTRPAAKFFFADGEAQKRAELLRQHLPQQAAEIVRDADEICHHKFRLLGHENLDYGKDIDWHLDAVHGKRTPLDPWFKIPFLEFAVVGDHKVTWELNRNQHLVTMARAWLLTKDQKYIQELIAQWQSWIQANPYPIGINWGSTLEVAFRSLSWIWVDKLLSDDSGVEPALSPPNARTALHKETQDIAEFRAELLPALAFHGRYIERYLSTYFSPNTHLLGEAVAMFFLGTLYPQMPGAARWKSEGWKIVLHEAGRQVRPDGVYFEQSLYYHVYALDFFLYARLLAAANGERIPETFDGVLLRMLNVVEALAQAGAPEGFGDDDGGRLFNSRRNRTENMTDPLALGVLAYNRDDLAAARLTEESIWLFGDDAVAKLSRPKTKKTAGSAAFPDGGLYILADGGAGTGNHSQPFPQVMMIDAGPQGVGRCGHGHADALSLRLTMNGSRWLVDSGSGAYISSDPADRNTFRGTSAHNTLRVDGVDQAIPNEPFSWTDVPTTIVESWVTGRTFTYFAGSHNGYERLQEPVTHRRCVLRVNGNEGTGIWFVRDVALGSGEHDLEILWHFASDVSLRQNGASELIATRPGAEPSALRLLWPEQTTWKMTVVQSLLSPAYGRYEPASVVRCETRVKLTAEIATALFAQNRTRPEQTQAAMRIVATENKAVQVYELQDGNEVHGFFFARDKQPWSFSPWSSDAEVIYYRIENERLAHLIVIGGSSVRWRGQPLLTAPRPSKFFEWQLQSGTMNGEQFSPTPLFDELKRSALSPNASSATSSYAEKH